MEWEIQVKLQKLSFKFVHYALLMYSSLFTNGNYKKIVCNSDIFVFLHYWGNQLFRSCLILVPH